MEIALKGSVITFGCCIYKISYFHLFTIISTGFKHLIYPISYTVLGSVMA